MPCLALHQWVCIIRWKEHWKEEAIWRHIVLHYYCHYIRLVISLKVASFKEAQLHWKPLKMVRQRLVQLPPPNYYCCWWMKILLLTSTPFSSGSWREMVSRMRGTSRRVFPLGAWYMPKSERVCACACGTCVQDMSRTHLCVQAVDNNAISSWFPSFQPLQFRLSYCNLELTSAAVAAVARFRLFRPNG